MSGTFKQKNGTFKLKNGRNSWEEVGKERSGKEKWGFNY